MSAVKDFVEAVGRFRNMHRLSQEMMAELCDISAKYYQKIESGRSNISLNTALRMAKVSKVSLDELAGLEIEILESKDCSHNR